MASITGLEYAFTKAPANMRSLVYGTFLPFRGSTTSSTLSLLTSKRHRLLPLHHRALVGRRPGLRRPQRGPAVGLELRQRRHHRLLRRRRLLDDLVQARRPGGAAQPDPGELVQGQGGAAKQDGGRGGGCPAANLGWVGEAK